MSVESSTPLPRSRQALEQARRVLDELPEKEASVEKYRDLVPWALDRLDNVWRTIDDESRGQRTPEFGAWWAAQRTGTRDAVKRLRNAEVKRGEISTRRRSTFTFPGTMTIYEDRSITFHDADGAELPAGPEGVHIEANETKRLWDFALPGLEDRPVQDVLETIYAVLADLVLPKAESLLAA